MSPLTRYSVLRTGARMPQLGFGTWGISPADVGAAVTRALDSGYRHLDLAYIYENQAAVGAALEAWMRANPHVRREDIFITSKLWLTDFRPDRVERALRATLDELRLGYLDLYLMHWPLALEPTRDPFRDRGKRDPAAPRLVDTWLVLERLCRAGLTRHIGVSNYNIKTLDRMLQLLDPAKNIFPAVNQVELHPMLPQHELLGYCRDKGIVVTAYSPLGSSDSPLLRDAEIAAIAANHGATPAQVLISWGLARDTVVIPKSSNAERIASNAAKMVAFSAEEMTKLDNLHKAPGRSVTRFIDPVKFWGIDLCGDDVVCE